MLLDWVRRRFRILFPGTLFLVSLTMLSWHSYSRFRTPPSLFARGILAAAGAAQSAVNALGDGISDTAHHYLWLVTVERENRMLRRRVSDLQRRNYSLTEQSIENDRLRRLLNFRLQEEIQNWIPAQVIGQNLSGLNRTVTINKGSRDGIRARMAVIAYDSALVGQILDEPGSVIGPHTCQVLLINDRRSRVDVAVQRPESRAKGILAGRPERDEVELLYADRLSDIRSGDLLVSSGYGGIFKKGWPVARVMQVRQEPDLFYPRVIVEPVVEFSRLEEVMVVPPEAEL